MNKRIAMETKNDGTIASPVRWNHVPAWMIQRLLATFGPTSFGTKRGWYLFWYWAREQAGGTWWLDHWGSTIVDGLEVVVSEPYYPVAHDYSAVEAFAEKLGCELLISEESEHCRGKTSRLLLMPTWTYDADVFADAAVGKAQSSTKTSRHREVNRV